MTKKWKNNLNIIMKDLRGKTRRKATTANETSENHINLEDDDKQKEKVPETFQQTEYGFYSNFKLYRERPKDKSKVKPKCVIFNELFAKFEYWLKFNKISKLYDQVKDIKES